MNNNSNIKNLFGITTYQAGIFIAILVVIIAIMIWIRIRFKDSKNIWKILMFTGALNGIVLGLIFAGINKFDGTDLSNSDSWQYQVYHLANLLSRVFISLMILIAAPLIFFKITQTIIVFSRNQKIFHYIFRVVVILTIMVAIGIATGLGITQLLRLIDPSQFNQISLTQNAPYQSILVTIVSWIPNNIFSSGTFRIVLISTTLMAILFGVVISYLRNKHVDMVTVIKFNSSLNQVFTTIADWFIEVLPYSIVGMLVGAMMRNGYYTLAQIGIYLGFMIGAIFILLSFQLTVGMIFAKINPITYIKKAYPALVSAFLTQSSTATLPISQKVLREEFKINPAIATTSPTLATTMGMAACGGLFPVVSAMFIVHFGEQAELMNSGVFYLTIFISTLVFSFGLAGLPGTAYYAATNSFIASGINFDAVGTAGKGVWDSIYAMDWFVDMFRTMTNVNGALISALIAERRSLKKADITEADAVKLNHDLTTLDTDEESQVSSSLKSEEVNTDV